MLHLVMSVFGANVTFKAGVLKVFIARDLFNCKINYIYMYNRIFAV